MKKFFLWIKSSIEGPDGKPSSQKIMVYWTLMLFTFVVLSVGFANFYYPESVYHIIAGVILGQSAIRAWQTTKDHEIDQRNKTERIKKETTDEKTEE